MISEQQIHDHFEFNWRLHCGATESYGSEADKKTAEFWKPSAHQSILL